MVSFVCCTAVALAAIWMGRQLTTTYNSPFHKRYFYYLVAFYAFAFYGLWVPYLMRELLVIGGSGTDAVLRITRLLPFLGLPFASVSWALSGSFGFALDERQKTPRWYGLAAVIIAVFLPAGVLGIFGAYDTKWLEGTGWFLLLAGIFVVCDLLFTLVFTATAVRCARHKPRLERKVVNRFILLQALAPGLRFLALFLLFLHNWTGPVGLLLFFGSALIPFLYIWRESDRLFIPVFPETTSADKMATIFDRYGISPREQEVVAKICEGKSNRQIAEELYISLQTVKDHTHRIYSKIGINSRLKLVQLINGLI